MIVTDIRFVCAIGAAIIILLIVIHIIMRSKHPVRGAFLSLLPGVCALAVVDLTSSWTGVSVPVSPMNLAVSAVLGIPGVTTLLIVCHLL